MSNVAKISTKPGHILGDSDILFLIEYEFIKKILIWTYYWKLIFEYQDQDFLNAFCFQHPLPPLE